MHNAMSINSKYAAPEAIKSLDFLQKDSIPDIMVFGSSKFHDVYDALSLNPNIEAFAGILSEQDIPIKYVNFLNAKYEIAWTTINLNTRGFGINQEIYVMFGFKRKGESKSEIFKELLQISASLPRKNIIYNISRGDMTSKILKDYGYSENFLSGKKDRLIKDVISDITNDVPPKIYKDFIRFLILSGGIG